MLGVQLPNAQPLGLQKPQALAAPAGGGRKSGKGELPLGDLEVQAAAGAGGRPGCGQHAGWTSQQASPVHTPGLQTVTHRDGTCEGLKVLSSSSSLHAPATQVLRFSS